ncbi:hypothetical protein M0802_007700 [Mischocyttarus mexicanus]|nr:hypothetical protein M0802_007700 [Mischocyttarus mexicanus]
MASSTRFEFGFELLQKSVEKDVCKKEDVIILLVHWYLIKCGFTCIGYGVSRAFDQSDKGTELLPEEWNKGPNYRLRYLKNGKLFLLYGIKSEEEMLINLLRAEDESITNIDFPLTQIVNELHGPLEVMVPTYQAFLYKLNKELIGPLNPDNCKETSTQTQTPNYDRVLRELDSSFDPPRNPSRSWVPEGDPRRVGGSDLDPFGRSGSGGMLFDPFRVGVRTDPRGMGGLGVPGRLPHGAVPPGARFDPFGPPDINPPLLRRPQNPGNDEFPPPGYNDMFM